jgi:hypothetical protein
MSFTNASCRTIKPAMVPANYAPSNMFTAIEWGGIDKIRGTDIWSDGTNIYYSSDGNFVLNKATGTWEPKVWEGLTDINGEDVWTDGTNIYYSYDTKQDTKQYVLNGNIWEKKTWGGTPPTNGYDVWTDGTNIYHCYSYSVYVLNGDNWEYSHSMPID